MPTPPTSLSPAVSTYARSPTPPSPASRAWICTYYANYMFEEDPSEDGQVLKEYGEFLALGLGTITNYTQIQQNHATPSSKAVSNEHVDLRIYSLLTKSGVEQDSTLVADGLRALIDLIVIEETFNYHPRVAERLVWSSLMTLKSRIGLPLDRVENCIKLFQYGADVEEREWKRERRRGWTCGRSGRLNELMSYVKELKELVLERKNKRIAREEEPKSYQYTHAQILHAWHPMIYKNIKASSSSPRSQGGPENDVFCPELFLIVAAVCNAERMLLRGMQEKEYARSKSNEMSSQNYPTVQFPGNS
ncbi:hypothetical protein EV363DRAFT_1454169 [Boletus edulis]|nr:hypothetical protein EV363DRAFT_1454169 [Boletus edulis]